MSGAPVPGGGVVSIVVPAYNEAENLPLLVGRLAPALAAAGLDWRLVVVDDGSRDTTWKAIEELVARDPRISGIRLSRNFGHQAALAAGLAAAGGDAVVTMDADLQHPPEVVPRLVDAWRQGARIVTTERIDAAGTSLVKRWSSRAFYRILSFVADEEYRAGMSDFALLDRAVVEEIRRLGERRLFLRGLVQWVGFPSARVPFEAAPRAAGRTKYSFAKMLDFALTGITAMSTRPLRLGVLAGIGAAALSLAELLFVLWVSLVAKATVPGWSSTLVVTTGLFAALFVYLGILGEYVARIHENVQGRPRFIVEAIAGKPSGEKG